MIRFDDEGWFKTGHHAFDGRGFRALIDKTPNTSGRLDPSRGVGIVEHYTATRSARGAQGWLDNPKAQASAHFVIGDDDEPYIWQAASLLQRTWHAGDGRINGRNPNDFCIGIEHSNAGYLHQRGDGRWYTDNGQPVPDNEVVFGHDHKGTEKPWDNYDALTLAVSRSLHEGLADFFDRRGWTFLDCWPHSFAAPDRKSDTGPAFPLNGMRSIMGARKGSKDASIDRSVRGLQERLNRLGYSLVVDGLLGYQTHRVTRNFQASHPPLVVDGIAGPKTWAKLEELT